MKTPKPPRTPYEQKIQNREILGVDETHGTCDHDCPNCGGCGRQPRIATIYYVIMALAIIGFACLLKAIGLW